MSEQPAVTPGTIISKHGALAELRARREQDGSRVGNEPSSNPVSDAARQLGQRSAEVRRSNLNGQQAQPNGQQPSRLAPLVDKPGQQANSQRQAPLADQPEEAEDNADEAPDGQDVDEGQSEAQERAANDDDGDNATIDIDGEHLTKAEIKESYLRRADYTKKTMEVAEERRVLQQSLGAVTQNSQRIEQLVGMLQQAVGQEPDWTSLAMQYGQRPNGAMEFLAYKENWTQQKQVLNNVMAEKSRAFEASINQAKNAMMNEYASKFRPDWQDRSKMQESVSSLAQFAIDQGITPFELQSMHRTPMLRILDLAYQQSELQKSARLTDKIVRGKPKPVRPGTQGLRANAAESQLNSERQIWESNKHPDTRASMRWIKAKREYEGATGKTAPK